MTGPTHEPLDEQERELARILRALPGAEPSSALDQRILRAAADADAASPPRRSLRRWVAFGGAGWGIGGAAAAVLALGVGWHLLDPARELPMDAGAPIPAAAQDDSIVVDLGEPQAAAAEHAPAKAAEAAPAPPPATAPVRPARAVAREPVQAPAPFAADAAAPPPPSPAPMAESAAGLAASTAASPPAVDHETQTSAMQALQDARADGYSAEAGAMARQAKASGEREEAIGDLARARAGAMTPAAWIAQVRSLRDAHRRADAADSLRRFHQYYPQYAIPADLLPLLRE